MSKDQYLDAVDRGDAKAGSYIDDAISCYERGFDIEPRDYYPGINAAVLLYVRGDEASLARCHELLPLVAFYAGRRGGAASLDYWDVATTLDVAVLKEDWSVAVRAAGRLLILDAPGWYRKTTTRDLELVRRVRVERGLSTAELDLILMDLGR